MNNPLIQQLRKVKPLIALIFVVALAGCHHDKPLPVLNKKTLQKSTTGGGNVLDSAYQLLPPFAFVDQDSQIISNQDLQGKIYVADFFFTTCPTICPKMKAQMLRVYKAYENQPEVLLISHTIDPRHDTVAVLKRYAGKLGVESDKWHFLTGDKDAIYSIARAYMVSAAEDPEAPGGFIHSGAFILVDGNGLIRGYYDGTNPDEVDDLINDIRWLLNHPENAGIMRSN